MGETVRRSIIDPDNADNLVNIVESATTPGVFGLVALNPDGSTVSGASGDMLAATYDAASISEQLVGLTAAQTLTNKTLTSPIANNIQLTTGLSDPAHSEGLLYYDDTNKAVSYYNEEAEVAMQLGQEEWTRVRNESGATITNGSIVYISGGNGLPLVTLARADAEATYEAVGFATHDIENNTNGYITRGGIVRDVDTSAYSNGDDLYLSADTAGAFTGTAPSLPNYEVHVGHVVSVNATTGTILVHFRDNEADYEEIVRSFDGLAFDKPDVYVTTSGGLLYFEVEKTGGGGDMDFLIDGVRSTLDCTTGAGTGGRAQVQITEGSDANTPATNYLYVTDSGGTATLAASTSLPTGAFAWVGKCIVPDDTTWGTTGEYLIQRYTESFSNSNRGALSHQREKLRATGAIYISGGSQTLTINTGPSPDSVHLEVGSASVYQLHRQTFPAFTTGPYYYGNGTNQYAQISDLNAALNLTDGTAITNNNRYNLVIWGAVNYESGDCKLFVNLPTDVYGSDSQASADVNATADYSVPDDMRSVAFMISRVVLKYTTAGGGTFTEVDSFSILGTPPGVRSGGSGAIVSTEFVDTTFRLFDDGDNTKEIAFEASGITTGTTRTLTAPDADGTIALTSDITLQDAFDGGQSITIADTDNQTLSITQNDTTNNPDAVQITNTGTGDSLQINTTDFIVNDTGDVGIGANPSASSGKLTISGTNASTAGPHIRLLTAADVYPLMQVLGYQHDNVNIGFDTYFDGSWKSSDAGSNFIIQKGSDQLRFKYDSGITAGSAVTWNDGIVLDASGNVGIGSAPNTTAGKLTLSGANANNAGPHIRFLTDADVYPLIQMLPWQHDNIYMAFDCYWNGTVWKSSDAGSNFQFHKGSDTFKLKYDSGVAQGGNITWNNALSVTSDGEATFGTFVGGDAEVDDGNSSTADTIDRGTGNFHKSTMTGNCTYTFTAPAGVGRVQLMLVQDATGSRTATRPASVKRPTNGTAPTLSTGANDVDIISFYRDGVSYYGVASLDFA